MNYMERRQNPLPGSAPDPAILLSEVADAFGIEWLSRNDGNPLQQLWARRDQLATTELLLLGDALRNLRTGNERWFNDLKKKIRSSAAADRKGALFELLGLNLFSRAGQVVTPAAPGQQGYDGVIDLQGEAAIRLSIKNWDASHAKSQAAQLSAAVEQVLTTFWRTKGFNGLGIVITASRVPEYADWETLKRELPLALGANAAATRRFTLVIGGCWTLACYDMSRDGLLSDRRLSFSLIVCTPIHPNDEKNFLSKLDDARANLETSLVDRDNGVLGALLLKIPASVDLWKCEELCKRYVASQPETSVGLLILYQPLVANEGGSSHVAHGIREVKTQAFSAWSGASLRREGHVLIGKVGTGTRMTLVADGAPLSFADGYYVYQRGEVFRVFEAAPNAALSANLSNPASGIHYHAILRMNGQDIALEGIFPPTTDLLIV